MSATLKPIYNIVARELALGIDLKDICEARGLNIDSMRRVTRGDLFKEEVRKFQAEIDREILEEAIDDPILRKLKALSYRAVGVLQEEMENFDPESGASATSRISASDKILNKAGYSGKSDDAGSTKVILMISESKLDSVKQAKNVTEQLMKEVPDSVDGHLK